MPTCSGRIRGVGPVYTRKLVAAYSEAVFALIEQEPARLREVTGIRPMPGECKALPISAARGRVSKSDLGEP